MMSSMHAPMFTARARVGSNRRELSSSRACARRSARSSAVRRVVAVIPRGGDWDVHKYVCE